MLNLRSALPAEVPAEVYLYLQQDGEPVMMWSPRAPVILGDRAMFMTVRGPAYRAVDEPVLYATMEDLAPFRFSVNELSGD